jgi:hypothetical protein
LEIEKLKVQLAGLRRMQSAVPPNVSTGQSSSSN